MESQERLLDHQYDGIQEYDNPLPRWWVWLFYATIIFSILYAINPGGVFRGPGRIADYNRTMAEVEKKFPRNAGPADEAALVALTKDQSAIESGKTVFKTNCAVCHREDAGGNIGPNLTDAYWLHGGSIAEIHKTIDQGVLDKGMPNWGKMLQPQQVNAVTVYVASLRGTNPPNPKAPQGEKVEAK